MNTGSDDGCSEGGCEDALAALQAYLDGELPNAHLEDIKHHLAACYPCTDRASFEEQLRAIVRRECVDDPPERLLVRIREHLDIRGSDHPA